MEIEMEIEICKLIQTITFVLKKESDILIKQMPFCKQVIKVHSGMTFLISI